MFSITHSDNTVDGVTLHSAGWILQPASPDKVGVMDQSERSIHISDQSERSIYISDQSGVPAPGAVQPLPGQRSQAVRDDLQTSQRRPRGQVRHQRLSANQRPGVTNSDQSEAWSDQL